MEQISRKDVADYRDDQEELKAWRIAERRRQEEAFLQRVRDEAAELGRQLEPTPKWMQAIAQLRRRVIQALAEGDSKGETTISASIALSDMPWLWRRKWSHLADGCGLYQEPVDTPLELARGSPGGRPKTLFGNYPARSACKLLQDKGHRMGTHCNLLAPERLASREPLSALLVMFAP